MQKFSWWLTLCLIFFGTLIFLFSLYTASLAGLRRQLGLVGGGLQHSIDNNRLYRGLVAVSVYPECDYLRAIKPVPRYIFSSGIEKITLGRELSQLRIECGMVYTLAGNIERGVYTLLKAIRYEQAGILLLSQMIEKDRAQCSNYQTSNSPGLIEAYLGSASGAVYAIIEREYLELQRLNFKIVEMCSV